MRIRQVEKLYKNKTYCTSYFFNQKHKVYFYWNLIEGKETNENEGIIELQLNISSPQKYSFLKDPFQVKKNDFD